MKIGPKDNQSSQTTSSLPSTPGAPGSTPLEQITPESNLANLKASQQNANLIRSEHELQGLLLQKQIENTGRMASVTQTPAPVTPALSEFNQQVQSLMQKLAGASSENPFQEIARKLELGLSQTRDLSIPPEMDMLSALNMTGTAPEMEMMLYAALSAAFAEAAGIPSQNPEQVDLASALASLLSGLQGRSGESPIGYPPGAFAPPRKSPEVKASNAGNDPEVGSDSQTKNTKSKAGSGGEAGRKERAEQAEQLAQSGTLGAGKNKDGPEISQAERDSINNSIAGADDDAAVRFSNDKKVLSVATPDQKAKLIRELMSGHTSDSEDRAITRIMSSCTSKEEYDKVMEMAGGVNKVFDELDADDAKSTFSTINNKMNEDQKQATNKAVEVLEKCESPEEAKELAAKMGGTSLKHQIKDPALMERLDAVGKRFQMPALGYGLPPQEVEQKRAALHRAFEGEDSDLAVALSQDRNALNVASPTEKAHLIKELQRGWTKDSQDMAVYRIAASCTTKEEFDEVAKLAGGKEVLKDLDNPEAKQKMDELCGAWGRTDIAEDKNRAENFKDVLADPRKQSELSATRPPTEEELKQLGGNYKVDSKGANTPEMQQANQAMGMTRENIQQKSMDINWDPQAKNELVLEQRRRELTGSPKLDWTGLALEADKIMSDPDFDKKVMQFQAENGFDSKEAPQKYVTDRMQRLAVGNGISEQTLKSLVTQRMGQIYGEGAKEMNGYRNAIAAPLQKQLVEVEMKFGPDSPEARSMRARLSNFDNATAGYTNRLGQTSAVCQTLFPVPASVAEDMVSALPVVVDIAAAVAVVIPGVGPAITGTYFGAKAAVSAAQGDALGALTSLASAIPGFGGVVGGAAGAALQTGGRLAQTGIGVARGISDGNVVGTLGSLAGMGAGAAPFLDYAQKGLRLADGISRGDVSAIAGAAGGLLQPIANDPAIQSIVQNPVVQQTAQYVQQAIPFFESIAKGDATGAFNAIAGQLGAMTQNNPEAQRVLGLVNDGAKFVDALRTGDYGKFLGDLNTQLQQLGVVPQGAALGQSIGQLMNMVGAIGSGDAQQLVNVLKGANGVPGFIHQYANGTMTKTLTEISGFAKQFIHSPGYQSTMDLMQSGMRFLSAVESGEIVDSLNRFPDLSNAFTDPLTTMLAQTQPLIQAMKKGDFENALNQLRSNPLTNGIAQNLSKLEPLAGLVQPDWQKAISAFGANLDRLAQMDQNLDQIQVLEKIAEELQEHYGLDYNAMAQSLFRLFGVAKAPYTPRSQRMEFPAQFPMEVPASAHPIPAAAVSTPNPAVIASVAETVSANLSSKAGGSQKTAAARRGEAALEGRLKQADIQITAPNRIPERPVENTSNTEPTEFTDLVNRQSRKSGGKN